LKRLPAGRYAAYARKRDEIAQYEGGLLKFSQGYLDHGFSVLPNGDVRYLEWIPNAERAFLIGDFSTLGARWWKGVVGRRLTLSVGQVPACRGGVASRRLEPQQPPDGEARVWLLGDCGPAAGRQPAPDSHPAQHQSQGQG